MKEFHISQAHEKIGLNGNLIFWISMIKESQKLLKPNKKKNVLDFGCGSGDFLHLFDLMDYLDNGLAIDLDKKAIKKAIRRNKNNNITYKIPRKETLKEYQNYFDVVYSQEVLYTIKNLKKHAKDIFNILKDGGVYLATMGCHINNPLWSKRRKIIRDEESYYAYDYSIEEVAEIFHSVGFEVCLKRLPVEYFMVYDPKITKDFSNSLLDLVNTSYENKMLFCFWKPYREKKYKDWKNKINTKS